MLCLSGFELYSRWVPLTIKLAKRKKRKRTIVISTFDCISNWIFENGKINNVGMKLY